MTSEHPVLLLTGASRGIGHATVQRFSEAGWQIITCSRDAVPPECKRDPNWSHHITADLGDPADLDRFVAEAKDLIEGPLACAGEQCRGIAKIADTRAARHASTAISKIGTGCSI